MAIRDALAADTVLATEYADLKVRLADEYPLDRMMYRYFKGSFIENRILHQHVTV